MLVMPIIYTYIGPLPLVIPLYSQLECSHLIYFWQYVSHNFGTPKYGLGGGGGALCGHSHSSLHIFHFYIEWSFRVPTKFC